MLALFCLLLLLTLSIIDKVVPIIVAVAAASGLFCLASAHLLSPRKKFAHESAVLQELHLLLVGDPPPGSRIEPHVLEPVFGL